MDTQREIQIYNNYRSALTAINRCKGDHAAQRRNSARKITVDRYNVSFADLKRIIREQDEARGVTHEHPAGYALELERENEYAAAVEAYNANPVPCQCGNTELVRVRVNPYEIEINDVWRLMVRCYECYRIIELDI